MDDKAKELMVESLKDANELYQNLSHIDKTMTTMIIKIALALFRARTSESNPSKR